MRGGGWSRRRGREGWGEEQEQEREIRSDVRIENTMEEVNILKRWFTLHCMAKEVNLSMTTNNCV